MFAQLLYELVLSHQHYIILAFVVEAFKKKQYATMRVSSHAWSKRVRPGTPSFHGGQSRKDAQRGVYNDVLEAPKKPKVFFLFRKVLLYASH